MLGLCSQAFISVMCKTTDAPPALGLWKCDFFKHFCVQLSVWMCFWCTQCAVTKPQGETEYQWKTGITLSARSNQIRYSNYKCSNILLEFPVLCFFWFTSLMRKMIIYRNIPTNLGKISYSLSCKCKSCVFCWLWLQEVTAPDQEIVHNPHKPQNIVFTPTEYSSVSFKELLGELCCLQKEPD